MTNNFMYFHDILMLSKHEVYAHIFSIKGTYYKNCFHLAFPSISDHTILYEHTHVASKSCVICRSFPTQVFQYLFHVLGGIRKLAQTLTSDNAVAGTLYLHLHALQKCTYGANSEKWAFWKHTLPQGLMFLRMALEATSCPAPQRPSQLPFLSLGKMVSIKLWECCQSRMMPMLSKCCLFNFNVHLFYYGQHLISFSTSFSLNSLCLLPVFPLAFQ